MPNTVLTLELIPPHIQTMLGSSGVNLEVDAKDIKECLVKTIALYNRCRPQRDTQRLQVCQTQKRYGPLDVTYPGLQGVVAVQFVSSAISDRVDPFDTLNNSINRSLAGADGTPFGEIDQQLEYMEMGRRVASAENEWKGQWERDKHYYLYVDIRAQYFCSITYTWHVTPDDADTTGMSFIPDGDTDWILNHVLALTKQILSRIRGKFGGIPNSDGGTDSVDYEMLADEGKQEAADLKVEIEARRRPLVPEIE